MKLPPIPKHRVRNLFSKATPPVADKPNTIGPDTDIGEVIRLHIRSSLRGPIGPNTFGIVCSMVQLHTQSLAKMVVTTVKDFLDTTPAAVFKHHCLSGLGDLRILVLAAESTLGLSLKDEYKKENLDRTIEGLRTIDKPFSEIFAKTNS